jgi:hypothetical protein
MALKGQALRGALAGMPKGVTTGMAQGAGLRRLSPGVYRNTQGQLVNSKGGSLPGQQQQRPPVAMPSRNPYTRAPQSPQMQPPQNGMLWAGGSPNFDEMTGQYRNGFNPMPRPNFSQYGPIQFQGQNPGMMQQYDTGFVDYMKQKANVQLTPEQQAQRAAMLQQRGDYSIEQQPQGAVAPSFNIPNNGNIY